MLVQELNENDPDCRYEFNERMMEITTVNPSFWKIIYIQMMIWVKWKCQ